MPEWVKYILVGVNGLVIVVLCLIGADYWIRSRVAQGVDMYHTKVIMPMTRQAPQTPQPSQVPVEKPKE